jgi:UDP-N-acetylmuramate dehydrogenase
VSESRPRFDLASRLESGSPRPRSSWVETLARALGGRATGGVPLGPLTTYGVGGPAALFVEVETPEDLEELRRACAEAASTARADLPAHETPPVFVIGRGSNVLVADAGFDGLVLQLGSGFSRLALPEHASQPFELEPSPVLETSPPDDEGFREAEEREERRQQKERERGAQVRRVVVTAGAAVALPVLARRAAQAGWHGLSWAVGVPGSVGGAVRMNAGGHGSDMASCLVRYRWVDLLTSEGGTDDVRRLAYGYRSSSVRASQVVLEADLEVTPGSAEEERAAVASIVRWRREHQPGGSNAGSVFTNPQGDSAGRLIEEAGLKGFRLGSAQVSEKHANFIQADKDGRADDVRALMDHVTSIVAERCGVVLQAEVRLLGFDGAQTGAVLGNGGGR